MSDFGLVGETGSRAATGATRPTIAVIGANHRDTPISLRERLSILPAELPEVLASMAATEGVEEVVALSTCNRVELYAAYKDGQEPSCSSCLSLLASALCEAKALEFEDVSPSLYRIGGSGAVRHLFEVASGLDSMVPGENEVFAQVKAAYLAAVDAGTVGPELSRLFQRAFKVTKDVRSRTGISRRKVSVATVVADLARKVFGRLGKTRVVLVGAGKMADITLRTLVSGEARVAVIANRSLESALALASRYGGEAVGLGRLGEALARADILVASAAAPGPIITAEQVKHAVRARRSTSSRRARPESIEGRARRGAEMLLVDLGVPRNIDREVAHLDGVVLYDVDDLQEVVAANLAYRLDQAEQARSLIAEEVRKFAAELRADGVSGTIAGLCQVLERIGENEFARTVGRLGDLTGEQRREVGLMARRIVGKVLHSAAGALREEARAGNGAQMERSIRRIFGT